MPPYVLLGGLQPDNEKLYDSLSVHYPWETLYELAKLEPVPENSPAAFLQFVSTYYNLPLEIREFSCDANYIAKTLALGYPSTCWAWINATGLPQVKGNPAIISALLQEPEPTPS